MQKNFSVFAISALTFIAGSAVANQLCKDKIPVKDLKAVSETCLEQVSADALQLSTQLEKKNFQCEKPSAIRGLRCRGSLKSYNQKVNIFIPANYSSQKKTDWHWHFHGFTDTGFDQFNIKDGTGDFGKMLTSADVNTLMLVPESTGKCADFNAINGDQFSKMLSESKALLTASGASLGSASKLGLSGHSGAYTFLAKMGNELEKNSQLQMEMQSFDKLALLDSVYGTQKASTEGLSRLIKTAGQQKSSSVLIAFNPNGSNFEGNVLLQNAFGIAGKKDKKKSDETVANASGQLRIVKEPTLPHIQFPQTYLPQILSAK